MNAAVRPLVSVVVTTKNEEHRIERCLLGVAEQTYAPIELIVVDNGSTDRTKEVAGRFTVNVFDHGPERSAQRNYGMLVAASGRYVMYLDADMIPSPDLVASCVDRMSIEDCVALHIPEIVLGGSYFCRVRRFERSFYDGTVIDGARFFSQDVLRQVGGFDESITGVEDWDLDKKLKGLGPIVLLGPDLDVPKVPLSDDLALFIRERGVDPDAYRAVVFHDESHFRLRPYLSKKLYYGKWFDTYTRKWGAADPDVRRQFSPAYRYVGVFIEQGKWKRLIGYPVMTIGMYFLRGLVGATQLVAVVRTWARSRSARGGLFPCRAERRRVKPATDVIDQYAAAHPQFGGTQEITPLLQRAIEESSGRSLVLDVGCGEGGTLPAIERAGRKDIVGCELSERRAEVARHRGFFVIQCDALQLPVAADSAGLVVSRHLIEHVEDDAGLVNEIARVLAPDALVYLETPLRLPGAWYPYRNVHGEWMLDPTHLREYRDPAELLDLLAPAGLKVEAWNVRPIRFPLLHGLYRLIPWLGSGKHKAPAAAILMVPVPRYREIQVLARKK